MKLSDMQKIFSDVIRGADAHGLSSKIVPGGALSADEAVAVYQEGYRARLTEALGECYEAVWRVLGDDDFFAVCDAFIPGHISQSYNLSSYGDEFPDFLAAERPQYPFLKDLALFEKEFRAAFHAPEAPVDLAGALGADPAVLLLEMAPSFRRFSFPYSILSIWELKDQDSDGTDLDWNIPESFYIARRNFQLFCHRLSDAENRVLEALAGGVPLGAALDRAGAGFTEEEARSFFESLMLSGAVSRIHVMIQGG